MAPGGVRLTGPLRHGRGKHGSNPDETLEIISVNLPGKRWPILSGRFPHCKKKRRFFRHFRPAVRARSATGVAGK